MNDPKGGWGVCDVSFVVNIVFVVSSLQFIYRQKNDNEQAEAKK
jgi:hypothetical protein